MQARLPLFCLALILNSFAVADEPETLSFFASAQLLSDYRFFGSSSSDGKPALQGSLHVEHEAGWYAGVFTSTVDFDDGNRTRYEFDTYAGRRLYLGDWTVSGELLYLAYDERHPGPTWDYWLGTVAVRHYFDEQGGERWLDLAVSHTEEGSFASGRQTELKLEGATELPRAFRLTGNVGYGFHQESANRLYWGLGLERDWRQLTFGLWWVGSDQSRAQCFDTDWCDEAFLGSILLRSW